MRPHNKSTLWDEFLEHWNKDKRMFNAKHKRAYCKHCVKAYMAMVDNDPALRAEFQQKTDITESWDEWKKNKGFELFEYISGRSSNMQRHIRNCPNLDENEKVKIMERFKKAYEEKKPRDRGLLAESSSTGAQQGVGIFSTAFRSRPAASTPSDDDVSVSSTVNSPPISRRNTTASNDSSGVPERPSPRLSVQSILNDEEVSSSSGSRGQSSDPFVASFTPMNSSTSTTGGTRAWQSSQLPGQQQHRWEQRPLPPPLSHSTSATMDHLERASSYSRRVSEEIDNARFSITGHKPMIRVQPPPPRHQSSAPYSRQHQRPIFPSNSPMNPSTYTQSVRSFEIGVTNTISGADPFTIIQQQNDEIGRLRQENAELKKRYNVLNEAYNRSKEQLKSSTSSSYSPGRRGISTTGTGTGSSGNSDTGSGSGGSSVGSTAIKRERALERMDEVQVIRREADEENREDEDIVMETPRASSAPALFSFPPPPGSPGNRHDTMETASTSSREGGAEAKKRKISETEIEGRRA